jgi:hypothetical protein
MSDTPRTDAAIKASKGQWGYLLRDLAQEMERDLAAERELADRLAQAILFNEHEVLAGEDLFWSENHASALAAWKEARRE